MKPKNRIFLIPLTVFFLYYLAGYIPYLTLAPLLNVPNQALSIALGAAGYAFQDELFHFLERDLNEHS